MSDFRIKTCVLGPVSTNCYLVYNDTTKEAVAVDPGDNGDYILNKCKMCIRDRAMDYLLDNGHRKLAVIEGRPELDSTRLRHRGWRISMRKHGLDPDQVPMINGNYRYGSGYSAAKQLLSYEPTAILCFNDEMAFGARTAIDEAGLSVPGDVSPVSYTHLDVYKRQHMGDAVAVC